MRHLNYNHLLYFWTVANEGSITRAAEVLYLTPQTISGQIRQLEESVGSPLFNRVGRRLTLSDTGKVVKQYADEIFDLGAQLAQRMKSNEPGSAYVLNVGVVASIAKLIGFQLLRPAFSESERIQITCMESELDQLLADLAASRLDLVISDRMIPTGLSIKAYNHLLGESEVAFFCGASLWERLSPKFPASLDGAPMLLPLVTSALRRRLDDWFEQHELRPEVVAEFQDSALMKAFGHAGIGVFPAPSVIADEIETMYDAKMLGPAVGVKENYYAISPERKIRHPAASRVTQLAKDALN